MKTKLFLTCEHGGAKIPPAYKNLFRKNKSVLKTHRALDIGALAVAFDLQKNLRAPLEYSETSRLVVDLNRHLENPTLFSEFTGHLGDKEKIKLLEKYYHPHWSKIRKQVAKILARESKVLHIAVHSMTDNLNGQKRPMQIALLYDAKRKAEKKFASLWIKELRKEFPGFKIVRNNPYNGANGGVTGSLRTELSENKYLGIEIELNQGYLQALPNAKARKHLSQGLADSLARAMENF